MKRRKRRTRSSFRGTAFEGLVRSAARQHVPVMQPRRFPGAPSGHVSPKLSSVGLLLTPCETDAAAKCRFCLRANGRLPLAEWAETVKKRSLGVINTPRVDIAGAAHAVQLSVAAGGSRMRPEPRAVHGRGGSEARRE